MPNDRDPLRDPAAIEVHQQVKDLGLTESEERHYRLIVERLQTCGWKIVEIPSTSETWNSVVGYETLYEVSNLGRVRSVDRTVVRSDGRIVNVTGRNLKALPDATGTHYVVDLYRGGKRTRRMRLVHTLVAESFLGPRKDGYMVCHFNGDGHDNRVENLRYDTARGNAADAKRHQVHIRTHCKNGHEFTPENTVLRTSEGHNRRVCLICRRAVLERHRLKKTSRRTTTRNHSASNTFRGEHMTDRQELLRTIAAGTAVKQIADEAITAAKKALQADLPRGTEYLYDSADPETRQELGYATVPKPTQPTPTVTLADEEVIPWLLSEDEDAVEVRYVIKDWAREQIKREALVQHAAGGTQMPGVEVTVPASRPASARFTPAKNLVELVRGMWVAGDLDLADVLSIEPARPEAAA